jgi:hypothetical protein
MRKSKTSTLVVLKLHESNLETPRNKMAKYYR